MTRPYSKTPAAGVFVFILLFGLCACGGKDDSNEKPSAAPEPTFGMRDASSGSGLDLRQASGHSSQRYIVEVKAIGVGLIDYDNDGLLDVVLTSGSTLEKHLAKQPGFGSRIYRNLGGLRFEDVSEKVGFPQTGWTSAAVAADYDGDGDTDLFLTQYGANILLRNDGGRFTDVSAEAGIVDYGWGTSALFDDLDGDGDLDLYVCNYLDFDAENPPENGKDGRICLWKDQGVMCGPRGLRPQRDLAYENQGDGRFVEASEKWGLQEVDPAYALGVMSGDFDNDGKNEIYVANDGLPNYLFEWRDGRYEETGYFKAVAFSDGGATQAGMGVDAADINGDGIEDIVCTNFSNEVNNVYLSVDADLYDEGALTTGSAQAGLKSLGWGTALRDFDLDGYLDFFVANGHVYPQAAAAGTGTDYRQSNILLLGRPGPRFEQVDSADHSALRIRAVSRAAAFGDLDNDGDIDVVVANLNDKPTLIETQVNRETSDHHFVGVRLSGPGKNKDGIGARVTLINKDSTGAMKEGQVLTLRRQSSFQASNDPRLVFGLGTSAEAKQLRVRWPDGKIETFDAAIDEYQTLEYGKGRS